MLSTAWELQRPGSQTSPDQTRAQLSKNYGKLPLSFEVNQGQSDPRVRFLSRGRGYTLFLTRRGEAVLALRKAATREAPSKSQDWLSPSAARREPATLAAVLRMNLLGAKARPQIEALDPLPAKANYFIGSDPKKWRTNIPTYARVKIHGIYPGIDLVYYGNQQQLEQDFVVTAGADPGLIRVKIEGAQKLSVDGKGNLVVASKAGEVRLGKPLIYQEAGSGREQVAGSYALQGANQLGFHVGSFDRSRPLVIDPVLFYSTYLGGSGEDFGLAIAVDGAHNAYVTGYTTGSFPTTSGASQTTFGGGGKDAFVTKLNPTGSGLVYSTYLGGSSVDVGLGIAVDATGNAYITGQTYSNDFPTTPGAFRTTFAKAAGCGGACPCAYPFVTKLNPSGSGLVYSTYVGGSGHESGNGIAVDAAGNAYVVGGTQSPDFPTTPGAFQPTGLGVGGFCAPTDGFVTKVNPTGTGLVYSTYLGPPNTGAASIAIDSSGNAYVTGTTLSSSFPTTAGAFQTTFGGGGSDAFVTKLNPLGTGLVYSTYLGGSGQDGGFGIALDTLPNPNAYVTGSNCSTNFPTTPGAFQTAFQGGACNDGDAFVTKVNPLGTGLVYSTYLGGSGEDHGSGIAVDSSGNAYVAGYTTSTNFPTANPVQAANAGGFDAFVTKVNPTGTGLVYSTYLGGSGLDLGRGIAVDDLPNPNAYVAGETKSTNFPTTSGAFQASFGGGNSDAFVVKIANIALPPGATSGKVTGGGTVNVSGGIANFGFTVQAQQATGQISGDLQYVNHASGANVHSVMFTTFVISGNTASFSGTCTNNGAPCTFSVQVQDNGQPGTNDSFTISINGGPLEGGTLRSGNIQIHQSS